MSALERAGPGRYSGRSWPAPRSLLRGKSSTTTPRGHLSKAFVEMHRSPTSLSAQSCFLPFLSPGVDPKSTLPPWHTHPVSKSVSGNPVCNEQPPQPLQQRGRPKSDAGGRAGVLGARGQRMGWREPGPQPHQDQGQEEARPAAQPRGPDSVLVMWPPSGFIAYLGRWGVGRSWEGTGLSQVASEISSGVHVSKSVQTWGKNYFHQIRVYINTKLRLAQYNKGRRDQRPREVK